LRPLSPGRLEAAGYGRQDACRYDAFWPLALQPFFGAAAQLGGVRGLVLVLFHGVL
jgi:hypothetical protein